MNVYECIRQDKPELAILIASNLRRAESHCEETMAGEWVCREFEQLNSVVSAPKVAMVAHYTANLIMKNKIKP